MKKSKKKKLVFTIFRQRRFYWWVQKVTFNRTTKEMDEHGGDTHTRIEQRDTKSQEDERKKNNQKTQIHVHRVWNCKWNDRRRRQRMVPTFDTNGHRVLGRVRRRRREVEVLLHAYVHLVFSLMFRSVWFFFSFLNVLFFVQLNSNFNQSGFNLCIRMSNEYPHFEFDYDAYTHGCPCPHRFGQPNNSG